jgi:hypothetical protein
VGLFKTSQRNEVFWQQKQIFRSVGTIAVAGLILSFSSALQAYQKEIFFRVGARTSVNPVFKLPSPKAVVERIDRTPGLKATNTRLERAVKNDKIIQKLNSDAKFRRELTNLNENPELYQSWLEEVNDLFQERRIPLNLKPKRGQDLYTKYFVGSRIDMAKKLAKEAMLFAVLSNWSQLKSTIFNELTVEDAKTARLVTLDKFKDRFFYNPRSPRFEGHDQNYYFEFEGSSVTVDRRNLSIVRVVLSVDHRFENELEAGAENIRADNDDQPSSTDTESSDEE